jgi:septal ring factor EnvC (AmiA/AmiB activator)
MIGSEKMRALAVLLLTMVAAFSARAQDIPGLEICTAERDMVRRTSCLQSNVNFLQASITKEALAAKRNLDAANRQIEDLRREIGELRKTAADLQKAVAELSKTKVEPDKVPK